MSKYESKNFRMGNPPDTYRMASHNRVSWDKIVRVFREHTVVTYMTLKNATAGHKHGSESHHGRDSASFVDYCARESWIMVTPEVVK